MSKEVIKPEQFAHINSPLLDPELLLEPSQEELEALKELYEGLTKNIGIGKLIEGTILEIDASGATVDVGFKSNGLIPRYEFSVHELKKFKAGDKIEVMLDEIEGPDGAIMISYEKAKAMRAWDEIMKLFDEGKPVEGTVTHKVKGGLNVDIGIPAFLPGSQIDLQRVTDFDQYVNHPITAHIIKINKKRGNVIISRRKYLSEQRSESRKKILDTLSEGAVLQGTVKNITNYGAFIDIGGVDGLLHITDMTWGRIAHPTELIKIGDTITVKILSFDKDNEKISLGIKQLTDNPWEKAAEKIKIGEKIKGKISSITDYGLFVEVAKGVEGLVHISEISWTDRINDLTDKFKVGEEIEVLVVSFDKDNRRMSLSVKQMEENPWSKVEEKFKVGEKVEGTISNITDFGIFVQLMPGIDGLVHVSDLSWTEHVDHPNTIYKKGDKVSAIVLGVDKENKKISLGIKQISVDPWEEIEKLYPVNSTVEGVVSKITNFGAFIKLPSGVEGLIHISEVSDENVEKVEDVLKVGQAATFKVINVNKNDRKLGLSLKTKSTSRPVREKAASPKVEKSATSTGSKTKNLFQLELEKYTARQKEDDSKDDE